VQASDHQSLVSAKGATIESAQEPAATDDDKRVAVSAKGAKAESPGRSAAQAWVSNRK
jgi:hypothetical protein